LLTVDVVDFSTYSPLKRLDRTSRDVVLNVASRSRLGFGIIRFIYNPVDWSQNQRPWFCSVN